MACVPAQSLFYHEGHEVNEEFIVPMLLRGNAACDALRHGTQSVPV